MTAWWLRGGHGPVTRAVPFRWIVLLTFLEVLVLMALAPDADADAANPPVPPFDKGGDAIPHAAIRYRADLTRNARLIWGLDAPVATFAGQIHQESGWRPDAQSKYAAGLAQFTPDTAKWICGAYPALANPPNPPLPKGGDEAPEFPPLKKGGEGGFCDVFNPAWALRALVTYDKHLWRRVNARDDCNRMAMVLSAYNGGLGWLQRDIKAASAKGADPLTWFDSVEHVNAGRALWAVRENRAYPKSILRRWSPVYAAGGWGPSVFCS